MAAPLETRKKLSVCAMLLCLVCMSMALESAVDSRVCFPPCVEKCSQNPPGSKGKYCGKFCYKDRRFPRPSPAVVSVGLEKSGKIYEPGCITKCGIFDPAQSNTCLEDCLNHCSMGEHNARDINTVGN